MARVVIAWKFAPLPIAIAKALGAGVTQIVLPTPPGRKYVEQVKKLGGVAGILKANGFSTSDQLATLGFSESCQGVRALLADAPEAFDAVFAFDGIHANFKPGTKELDPALVDIWLPHAKKAAKGDALFVITHSGIVPPGYASTTQTADYLWSRAGTNGAARVAPPAIASAPAKSIKVGAPPAKKPYAVDYPTPPIASALAAENFVVLGYRNKDPNGYADHIYQAQSVMPAVLGALLVPRFGGEEKAPAAAPGTPEPPAKLEKLAGWKLLPDAKITAAVTAFAKEVLKTGGDYGTKAERTIAGTKYLARVEPHYDDHAGGGKRWHPGVTVYEADGASLAASSGGASIAAVRGLEKTTPAFRAKLVQVASDLGINPDWLATVISFESAGSFSPSAQNPMSKATGLIQFMRTTAAKLGTSIDALAKMSGEDQLDYVAKYFAPFKGKLKSLEDTYLAVFYPNAIGKPLSTVVFAEGTTGYKQNAGFDPKKTGQITVGAITSTIRNVLARAEGRLPVGEGSSGTSSSPGGVSLGEVVGGGLALFVGFKLFKSFFS